MRDQLVNLLIGIVSGIISGVIVTLYYRRKDEERDLLRYFEELRLYIQQLLAADDLEKFFMHSAPPRQYDWLKPSDEEQATISNALEQIKKIDELVSEAANKQGEKAANKQNDIDPFYQTLSEHLLELVRMQPAIAALANQHSKKI